MSYVFKENLVPSAKYSIKCPYNLTPQYVTIHNTSNDAPAANEITYMRNNSNATSFHFAVDDKEVIQGVPLTRNAWHAGDGTYGNGNRKSVGIEICYSRSGGPRYTAAEENAVYLAAKLLYKYNLPISRLKKHQDWSGKFCPHLILENGTWNNFKERVEWVLERIKKGEISPSLNVGTTIGGNSVQNPSTPPAKEETNDFKLGSYNKNVITIANLNLRSARSSSASILAVIPKGTTLKVGYIMYEGNKTTGTTLWGGVSYNGKSGFISLSYAKPASSINAPASQVITKGTPSNFKVGNLNKKVRIINCDYLNTHSSRDLSAATVNGSLKAGTIVTVNYILYEGNKATGNVLMGGVTIDGKQCFISMKYCQLV